MLATGCGDTSSPWLGGPRFSWVIAGPTPSLPVSVLHSQCMAGSQDSALRWSWPEVPSPFSRGSDNASPPSSEVTEVHPGPRVEEVLTLIVRGGAWVHRGPGLGPGWCGPLEKYPLLQTSRSLCLADPS
jgi:hypothetical protein